MENLPNSPVSPISDSTVPSVEKPTDPVFAPIEPQKTSKFKPLYGVMLVLGLALVGFLVVFGSKFLGPKPQVAEEVKVNPNNGIRIGFSLGDLREERWQKDRDLFVAEAEKAGAFVHVTSANADPELQNSQIENLITQGVDVLVIVPYDSVKIAPTIELAHKAGIKVLSYDRLIKDADVDFYLSFDNVKVGELEAQGVTAVKKTGNFAYIGGAPTDNNATLLKEGSMSVLQPLIDDKSIKIVVDEFTPDWKPEEACKTIKTYLDTGAQLDAVVAANDGTAFGAIRALKEYKLDGIVPVSGQDAELAACQRVIEGTQTMTVYKPIPALAIKAVEIALTMARGEEIVANNATNNGKTDVPSFFLEPIIVTKENMEDTVIKDGFHSKAEVYQTK